LKEGEWVLEQGMHIPGESPQEEPRVGPEIEGAAGGMGAERNRQDERES
jgi:hypothetical protein